MHRFRREAGRICYSRATQNRIDGKTSLSNLPGSYLLFAPANPNADVEGSVTALIVFFVIAIGVSFLCSIWEAVLLSTSSSFAETRASEGRPSGRIMMALKRDVDRPISAILTLNTIAHTLGASGVGNQAGAIFGNEWFALISAVLTFLILVLSEIIPKTLGAVYWQQLNPFTAYSLRVLVFVLGPVVWAFQRLTTLLASHEEGPVITRSELEILAQSGASAGTIDEQEHKIFQNLLRLESVQINTIMTPRTVVLTLQQDTTVREVMNRPRGLPYSRIPIYNESVDDITSFVLRYDMLVAAAKDHHDTTLKELSRPIISVPESLSVAKTMNEMIAKKQHIALVFDEYGGTAGVVTMEDAVESLLGLEITDESDVVEDMRVLAQARYERQRELLGMVWDEANGAPNGRETDSTDTSDSADGPPEPETADPEEPTSSES